MSTSVKKYESPVQFWVMLGPLFVIGIVLAMNVRTASMQWGLPLISLGGLLLCYFLRWKGCLLACGLLSIASTFQSFQQPSVGFVWTLILSLSFAVSFIVTTLFLDESQAVLDKLSGQSDQTKEVLTQFEELSIAQIQLDSERQFLASHLEQLKRELSEKEERLQSCDKLITIVHTELQTAHSRQEKLLQELFEASQQAAIFEQQVLRLQDQNKQAQIALHEAAQTELSKDTNSHQAQEAQVLHDAMTQEMKEHIETLSRERQSLEMVLSNLQGEFEELSLKAIKKSELFDIQSVEIENLKVAIKRSFEELRIEKNKNEEFKINSESHARDLNLQIENLTKKMLSTNQQIIEWQRKLNDFGSLAERCSVLQIQIQEHISMEAELRLELGEVASLYEKLQATNRSNVNLLSEWQRKLNDYSSLTERCSVLQMQIKEHISNETELRSKLQEATSLYEQAQATNTSNINLLSDCDSLKLENSSLKEEIERVCREKEVLAQTGEALKLAAAEVAMSFNEEDERKKFRELRRIEGLHQQMRDQFNEKSQVLDSTRRELFVMQEKCLSLQKDLEEREIFGDNSSEQSLYQILSMTEAELKGQVVEFNKETAQLHELIDILMQQSARA